MNEIRVQESIIQNYPTFRRGIVIAKNLNNHGHSKELEDLLNSVIDEACENAFDIKNDPRTEVWRDAHRLFGSNPNKFPPAHCSLQKRVQKPGIRIPFINKVVAIMNYNSIKAVTPVGGDDIDKAGKSLVLRYAEGDENFTPLGQPEVVENPEKGEIIYVVEGKKEVMCRRWNWRNGHNTLIDEGTRNIVMNIDTLGDNSEARAVDTRDMVAEMLENYCEANVVTTILSPSMTSYSFEI